MLSQHKRFALFLLLLIPVLAPGQQDYVGRYDLYNGFAYFDSPDIHLTERGYHLQAGINANSWLAFGFDYSIVNGTLTVDPSLLKPSLASAIAGSLAPLVAAGAIPATYNPVIPTDSTTQTFAAGPQLEYRHFRYITLFVRPSIGAIREVATPNATDPIAKSIAQQLAPAGSKTEWTGFYGVGGGVDLNFLSHFSLRMQADYVHNSLFTDILKSARNTTRLSIGPAFHFGRNVAK